MSAVQSHVMESPGGNLTTGTENPQLEMMFSPKLLRSFTLTSARRCDQIPSVTSYRFVSVIDTILP